jgi:hypothetical protein
LKNAKKFVFSALRSCYKEWKSTAMTRLIFTSFSALLLLVFLAPVASAQAPAGEQNNEGTPTMRTLNQYNPQDDSADWQPNNSHTDPGQANTTTVQPGADDTDAAQVDQQPGQSQPGQAQPGVTPPGQTQPGQTQPGQSQPGLTQPGQQPGQTQPGVTQPGTLQPGATRPGMMEQEARSLPTMRVLNEYNPRDHERDWQPNSPSHDIVSDRRTIEELRFGGQVPDSVAGESLSY